MVLSLAADLATPFLAEEPHLLLLLSFPRMLQAAVTDFMKSAEELRSGEAAFAMSRALQHLAASQLSGRLQEPCRPGGPGSPGRVVELRLGMLGPLGPGVLEGRRRPACRSPHSWFPQYLRYLHGEAIPTHQTPGEEIQPNLTVVAGFLMHNRFMSQFRLARRPGAMPKKHAGKAMDAMLVRMALALLFFGVISQSTECTECTGDDSAMIMHSKKHARGGPRPPSNGMAPPVAGAEKHLFMEQVWPESLNITSFPTGLDWRLAGWAFSSVEVLESHWAIHKFEGAVLTLSTQQAFSCAPTSGDPDTVNRSTWHRTCEDGGDVSDVFDYAAGRYGGQFLNSDLGLPYMEADIRNKHRVVHCNYHKLVQLELEHDDVMTIHLPLLPNTSSGYNAIKVTHPTKSQAVLEKVIAIKRALLLGPVSFSVSFDQAYHTYVENMTTFPAVGVRGVMSHASKDFPQDMCQQGTGHWMVIVGYNETAPEPYWIVRNSWGMGYPDRHKYKAQSLYPNLGYIFVTMKENFCGILDTTWIPYLEQSFDEPTVRRLRSRAQGSP
ncbi:RDL2 [Symbiodinium sp. CCMP2592]|nr:RDL2 [Symbiodinium sp. CCMP2592]